MTNHPNRSRLDYEPGFRFHEGDRFRGAIIEKVIKFYPMNNFHPDGPKADKVIEAMTGFQDMRDRPAHDLGRHIMLVRVGRRYKVTSAEHQARSLDPYDLAAEGGLTTKTDASSRFDALIDQYRADKRWVEADD